MVSIKSITYGSFASGDSDLLEHGLGSSTEMRIIFYLETQEDIYDFEMIVRSLVTYNLVSSEHTYLMEDKLGSSFGLDKLGNPSNEYKYGLKGFLNELVFDLYYNKHFHQSFDVKSLNSLTNSKRY